MNPIFHVFPGPFNQLDIEQVRFSYNTEYVTQFNFTKQWIEPSLAVDNDNVCTGQKQVHTLEMQQPFGLFSVTYQDLYASCFVEIISYAIPLTQLNRRKGKEAKAYRYPKFFFKYKSK